MNNQVSKMPCRGASVPRAASQFHGLLVIGLPVFMTACAQLPPMPQAPAEPPAIAAPGSPGSVSPPPYQISAGDVLDVKFWLNPELNEQVTVLPDGSISTSAVHRQLAAGLTLPQLDQDLARDYASILKTPIISVVVVKPAPCKVFLLGEVERPGQYEFPCPAPRLAQAIAVAGGLNLGADAGSIFILRHMAGNSQQFFATRFAAIKNGDDPAANIRLARNDEIFIPRSGITITYDYFKQYFQQFIATSVSVNYLINSNGTPTLPKP